MQQPFDVDGRAVHLSCSVGIALSPEHGHGTRLIVHAHAAMRLAKRSGGAGHALYAPALHDGGAFERLGLLADLRHAVARGELTLLYQPKIDARSGQVTGAEALLRWDHPTRGRVPPALFVPVAERYGLIDTLGQWVIDEACRQARAWRDAGLHMRVAVNLSALQLRDEGVVDRLLESLQRHGVRPGQFARAIVEAVLRMAHALGLKVVAEGVEDAAQRDLLVQMGCDELQGYFFAPPMSAEALTRWALDGAPLPSAHAPLEFRASLFAPSVQAEL